MQSFTHYLFHVVHADVCKKMTNLYLNLFLNISFVLIYLFCYYHATVIENIVYTRSIMYLAFAIFSIEMYNSFDQIFVIFLGWCVKLVDVSSFSNCCIVLPIFRWKKLCHLVLLDCKISIVFNCMLGRLYLLTFFFLLYHFDFYCHFTFICKFQFLYFLPV